MYIIKLKAGTERILTKWWQFYDVVVIVAEKSRVGFRLLLDVDAGEFAECVFVIVYSHENLLVFVPSSILTVLLDREVTSVTCRRVYDSSKSWRSVRTKLWSPFFVLVFCSSPNDWELRWGSDDTAENNKKY